MLSPSDVIVVHGSVPYKIQIVNDPKSDILHEFCVFLPMIVH